MSKNVTEHEQEIYDTVYESMEKLLTAMNYMLGDEQKVQAMLDAISKEHRTVQQAFFRTFAEMLKKYQASPSDLRNEASVDFAIKVSALGHYFPHV